jgi:hypothetical protein
LKAPRIWSENAQTGICGVFPPAPPPRAASNSPAAWRTVGSEAINKRDRLMALLAAYSAFNASRSESALANSMDISSWNSDSITDNKTSEPSTMISAAPLCRRRLRARNRPGMGVASASPFAVVSSPFRALLVSI